MAQEQPTTTIHVFEDEQCAYTACQCDEDVHTGDVLVINAPDGQIIGLAGTWPVALHADRIPRELHTFINDEYRNEVRNEYPEAFQIAADLHTFNQKYGTVPVAIHPCICI